jgi:hypothetical protein
VQVDSDEIEQDEAVALSAVALAPSGLGFRLANRHHPTQVPMTAWQRAADEPHEAAAPADDDDPLGAALARLRLQEQGGGPSSPRAWFAQLACASRKAAYAALLEQLDVKALMAVDNEAVMK